MINMTTLTLEYTLPRVTPWATVISYVALSHWLGEEWSGWLLVLPIILDVEIIARVSRK